MQATQAFSSGRRLEHFVLYDWIEATTVSIKEATMQLRKQSAFPKPFLAHFWRDRGRKRDVTLRDFLFLTQLWSVEYSYGYVQARSAFVPLP